MPAEQSRQPSPQDAYEPNHWELIDIMGAIHAALASNYRNERPRSSEHVGKQEELKAILIDALDIARSRTGRLATDAAINGKENYEWI